MMINTRNLTGIIPAAGHARRISPLPCSKEIYPIGQPDGSSRAVASYLLKGLTKAPANKSYFIIRQGKWDIPEHFRDGAAAGHAIAFLVTEATRGVPFTIDKAYPFFKDDLVLLGFPDIIFTPADGFQSLLQKQEATGADLVLGLFNAVDPEKTDMVEFNEEGRITDIIIKPEQTDLAQTWIITVWTPAFSQFLHRYVKNQQLSQNSSEIHLGDVFREAIQGGLQASYVFFKEGRYIDIGTPDNLEKANHIDWLA